MKHFLSATAIVLMGTTAVTAATEAELQKIQNVIPEATMADLESMGDSRVASIMNAIGSSDSEGDARLAAQALYEEGMTTTISTTADDGLVTEASLVTIQQVIPEASMTDLAALGSERIASILNAISSADSESDARNAATALYEQAMADSVTTAMASEGFANEANLSAIKRYVPDATMAELEAAGNEKVAAIMNAIASGDANDAKAQIENLLGR